jgi:dihydroorotate dehydrogenase electron transfer subunit
MSPPEILEKYMNKKRSQLTSLLSEAARILYEAYIRFDYYQNGQKMSKFLLPKGSVSGIFVREISQDMIKDSQALITHTENWKDYYLLSLKSPLIASQAEPGQFIMVKINPHPFPLLRRPFSIHSRDEENIEIVFQKIGIGTILLAQKQIHDSLDILGPLGKGFRIDSGFKGKTVFLVGGGRGIAPLNFLAQELADLGAEVKIFYGAQSISDLCLKDKFEQNGFELFYSTEDGTLGFKGLVSDLLAEKLQDHIPEFLYSCGPEEMMKKIAQIAKDKEIPAEFSLEAIMGCGFGICWSCVRRIRKDGQETWIKICEEGPVFFREEIVW